jgi:hypothetical protein
MKNFLELYEIIEEQSKGKLPILRPGVFYVAPGNSAKILNKQIGLELRCYGNEICKVGFPVNAYDKYINLIKEKQIAVEIYDYTNDSKAKYVFGRYTNRAQDHAPIQRLIVNLYSAKKLPNKCRGRTVGDPAHKEYPENFQQGVAEGLADIQPLQLLETFLCRNFI